VYRESAVRPRKGREKEEIRHEREDPEGETDGGGSEGERGRREIGPGGVRFVNREYV